MYGAGAHLLLDLLVAWLLLMLQLRCNNKNSLLTLGQTTLLVPLPYTGRPAAASYQRSLLKAFQRAAAEGRFALLVVDAPLLKARGRRGYSLRVLGSWAVLHTATSIPCCSILLSSPRTRSCCTCRC